LHPDNWEVGVKIGIWRDCSCALAVGALVGCADSDNPVALADLEPVVDVGIQTERIETFEEVEMRIRILDGNAPMAMHAVELELSPASGGETRTVTPTADGTGYVAHVTFFEPGGYHLRVMGTPERHRLARNMHEMEIEVHRRHMQVGTFWVELDVTPAPILPDTEGHIHLLVYDLAAGVAGDPVGGLDVEMAVHSPGGTETPVAVVEEEEGEYEAEHHFTDAGLYELHVEIQVDGQVVEGEFHVPVFASDPGDTPGPDDGGGHGH
jgi:hypothetical protein